MQNVIMITMVTPRAYSQFHKTMTHVTTQTACRYMKAINTGETSTTTLMTLTVLITLMVDMAVHIRQIV